MIRPIILLAALSFLAGCRAHMLETYGDQVQLFKTGQEKPGRGGTIRWLANGPSAFKTARRADAEKQMGKFCSGAYRIVEEGPRSKFGSRVPVGSKVTVEMDEWWYAAFVCAEAAR